MENLFAAIDIGSNAIKLKIIQVHKEQFQVLEDLAVPCAIGNRIYDDKLLSRSDLLEMLEALNYFKRILVEYDVKLYRAVATSAFREAYNALNVIEVLESLSGIKIERIEDSVEKFLTYKSIRDCVPDHESIRNSALLVEVNFGGSDITVYSHNKLVKNDELMLGSKRLKQIVIDLERLSNHYTQHLKAYIIGQTEHLWESIQKRKALQFIATGSYVKEMRTLFFNDAIDVSPADFEAFCERVQSNDGDVKSLVVAQELDWYEFVSMVVILDVFFGLSVCERVVFPEISLRDGILAELVESHYELKRYKHYNEDPFSMAKNIAKRYHCNISHITTVEKSAIVLFKALDEYFDFHRRDLHILRLAVILHEIGKFTRMKNYQQTSFEMIRNVSIFGFKQSEVVVTAHICRLLSRSERLKFEERLEGVFTSDIPRVYKLAAILSLADAIDKGKNQSMTLKEAFIEGSDFNLNVEKQGETVLEEWYFQHVTELFENTFGLKPELREV